MPDVGLLVFYISLETSVLAEPPFNLGLECSTLSTITLAIQYFSLALEYRSHPIFFYIYETSSFTLLNF
jgi:hypothetical protein